MILVTLGTQDKEFGRLLKEVERLKKENIITDEVIVQAGSSIFASDIMEVFDYKPKEELEQMVKDADIIITHGGVGSILSALDNEKKIIAFPRLKQFKEHVNDHQVQICEKFASEGYILSGKITELEKLLEEIKTFTPNKYTSNNQNFNNLIIDYIKKN